MKKKTQKKKKKKKKNDNNNNNNNNDDDDDNNSNNNNNKTNKTKTLKGSDKMWFSLMTKVLPKKSIKEENSRNECDSQSQTYVNRQKFKIVNAQSFEHMHLSLSCCTQKVLTHDNYMHTH